MNWHAWPNEQKVRRWTAREANVWLHVHRQESDWTWVWQAVCFLDADQFIDEVLAEGTATSPQNAKQFAEEWLASCA